MALLLIDDNFLPVVKMLIENAKKTIDITTFKAEICHLSRGEKLLLFWDMLTKKAKEGVRIRLLLNWNDERRGVAKTNLYAMTELKKAGIKTRFLPNNRCCHAKIICVDSSKAIIGSHNLSVKSTASNFEISYLITAAEEIAELSKVFSQSYNAAVEK